MSIMTVIAVSLYVVVFHDDYALINSLYECQMHFNYFQIAKDGRNTLFFKMLCPPSAYNPAFVQESTGVFVPLLGLFFTKLTIRNH